MGQRPVNPIEEDVFQASRAFGLDAVAIRDDLAICGSPQRSDFRCVVEGAHRRLVVMETIRERERRKKQAIIDRLDFLAYQGLPCVHPYIRSSSGRQIIRIKGRLWQASPYVQGMPLDRPEYAFDGWRGNVMADFMIKLRRVSRRLPDNLTTLPFSILGYIDTLIAQIRARESGLFKKLVPVRAFLQKRLEHVHGLLPVAFCHGDYHPLNMIWSDTSLKGVIDWEFSGTKPENYDAALLIGCIGMETPDVLAGSLVREFINNLKDAKVFSESSWTVLVEMIISIRFGWLSEWLRGQDREMIKLEMAYMNLLMSHADDLAALWYT